MSLVVFSWPLAQSSTILLLLSPLWQRLGLSALCLKHLILPVLERKNFSSTLLGSVIGGLQIKMTKDRLAREKNILNEILMLRSSQRNKTQRGS